MVNGLIGKKIGMTEFFDEEFEMVITTVVEAGPCVVVSKKTKDTDGYDAVQLGFKEVKPQRVSKPMSGHFKKAKVQPLKELKEFSSEVDEYQVGDVVKADIFKIGDVLDVTGTSKGKGFAGTMKRHGFSGQPNSHGGMAHRRPGSIGQASYPGRVWKGIKMPGRMGGKNVTLQGLKVVNIDVDNNLVFIKGSIPGPVGGTVFLKHTTKGGV
ncbi:MAG: 50S ribosomal protein L3 [Candidatus Dadabacteria bacterium]|nr:50S ribosomal protein L3 [Candidatus Dadabacteria bacterium]NIQ15169.1 50S ribosomal protein L3 [Candidatus Dadabacteria bacterium]